MTTVNTDDAAPDVVLSELCHCASCWENGARLLGNVRAGDIQRAIAAVLAERDELEALKTWRVDVTVALQREGGAFYADVPNHIRSLVAGWKQMAVLNEALFKECRWALDDVGGDSVYETQCGHNFYFDDAENPFKFCGYCGRRMAIVLTSQER